MNSLALINIKFMINCCLNSTFKIYKINEEVDDVEINFLVSENFKGEKRVNIT